VPASEEVKRCVRRTRHLRETTSKRAGRVDREMRSAVRTYAAVELNQQQCKLTGIRDPPAPCQSNAAIPYDFSELKDMIAWRDRINWRREAKPRRGRAGLVIPASGAHDIEPCHRWRGVHELM
jgi:hypothetical protein